MQAMNIMTTLKPYQRLILLPSILWTVSACEAPEQKGEASQPAQQESEQQEPKKVTTINNPSLWPERGLSPASNDQIETRITDILSKMSLEEKVGQIVQPELKYVTPEDVRKYHIGSILNGGGTTPNNDKYASVQDWANLAQAFYEASMDESDGKIGIPIIWGSDAIHGNNNLYGATIFPHNIGLGATNDPELIARIGSATAMEVVATGVDWTFGPTVAVVRDIRWGRTYESYSEDPEIVMAYAQKMVEAIQGKEITPGVYRSDKLVATAKHFLGDGGTTNGIDRGDTAISETELVDIHAAGYISALDGNIMTTMASFNSWNGERLHGSHYLITDILKKRMGFNGLVVSDWNGHSHVPGCTKARCPQSINAGIDLVMAPDSWEAFYHSTVEDVRNGEITMQRLDDAVSRVLRVKLIAGLFEAGPVIDRQHVGDTDIIGSPEHRAIAREAVRKSLVLLKNNDSILPISQKANILIAGDGADNIGKQSGGWTISWQGTGNTNDDFPGATSIYDGFKQTLGDNGNLHYDLNGKWSDQSFANGQKPDVAVVVFGEEPYAEWHGDIANIEYQYGTKTDLALLNSLKEQNIPVVSVFISGRPLWTNKELNASDAFVAAWLPGTEGNGIVDVLLRNADDEINYNFHGKLSFSWPKTIEQAVINKGQVGYDPLFAYGYGLNYSSNEQVSNALSENTNRIASTNLEDAWIFVSRAISPWQFKLIDDGANPVAVTGNIASSSGDQNLELYSIDKSSQEDARQLKWKGLRAASVVLQSEYPQDLDAYFTQQSYLQFELKVNEPPKGEVSMAMRCDKTCSNLLDITNYLSEMPQGKWQDINIQLSCFSGENTTLENITAAFVVNSTAALDISVANIKLVPTKEKSSIPSPTFSCS